MDDASTLFAWVNSSDSLAASLRTKEPVAWERHVAWLAERLRDPNTLLFIAEDCGEPIGQVRFQDSGEGPEVSIYVTPERRQQGLARDMLRLAMIKVGLLWSGAPLLARIKTANAVSRVLFESVGFRLVRTAEDHLLFSYDPSTNNGQHS